MGIKDLNKTVQANAPTAFVSVPLVSLQGFAVAIDTSLWLNKSKSTAMKEALSTMADPLEPIDPERLKTNIIYQMYGFISKLISNKITPVWIIDGPTREEKIAVQRRKESCKTKKKSIDEERAVIMAMSVLERTSSLLNNFRKMLLWDTRPTREERQCLRSELEALGIPVIDAPYDAEIYAAVLSRECKIIGVWSDDTDTYATGARLVFTGFDKTPRSEGLSFLAVAVPEIYHQMGMTQHEFRDFCIMCQCDFNNRVPGIGPAKSLAFLKTHSTLDEVVEKETKHDWSVLNIDSCRELLDGPVESGIKIEDLKINVDKWQEKMSTLKFSMELPPDPSLVECHD